MGGLGRGKGRIEWSEDRGESGEGRGRKGKGNGGRVQHLSQGQGDQDSKRESVVVAPTTYASGERSTALWFLF